MTNKQQLDTNGWVLIKNIFSESEISELRKNALEPSKPLGDVLSNPKLQSVFLNQKLINAVKEVLGNDELVYFGDSTVSIGIKDVGFHKDSRERQNPEAQEWKDPNYSLIRFGVYLQDHANHSGGLCLRDKSHLEPTIKKGKIFNAKTEVGDLLIWKLTTTHSSNGRILKSFPSLGIRPKYSKKLPDFLFKKTIHPRAAIFGTFGVKDDYCTQYIEYLKTRTYAVKNWLNTSYNNNQVKELSNHNVTVIEHDKSELQSLLDTKQTNDKFKQL